VFRLSCPSTTFSGWHLGKASYEELRLLRLAFLQAAVLIPTHLRPLNSLAIIRRSGRNPGGRRMSIQFSKADYRLIVNARIYGGIFWAVVCLGIAWIMSWWLAPQASDVLQLAMSLPTVAYFIIYFVGLLRRSRPTREPGTF
jgi:hypothetical protein